jgi:hypothetical protein
LHLQYSNFGDLYRQVLYENEKILGIEDGYFSDSIISLQELHLHILLMLPLMVAFAANLVYKGYSKILSM